MINGFPVYDTHVHPGRARHNGRQYSPEQILRDMDDEGIERSLLIPYPVVDDFRQAHDLIGAAVLAHPDRFSGAASLPAFLPEHETREELRRVVSSFGFRALKFQPQYQPLSPLGDEFFELASLAAGLGLALICHTGNGAPYALPSLFIPVARRFPEMPVVLAHAGGQAFCLEAIAAATVCPNICLELSTLTPAQVHEVLRHVPASRLMIGSDLPESRQTELRKITDLRISETERRQILWDTPRRVLDGALS
jgi:predicted TIM-barrel fold metal-dependent hydrolase